MRFTTSQRTYSGTDTRYLTKIDPVSGSQVRSSVTSQNFRKQLEDYPYTQFVNSPSLSSGTGKPSSVYYPRKEILRNYFFVHHTYTPLYLRGGNAQT